jgi:YVTN family beta-propeller protein
MPGSVKRLGWQAWRSSSLAGLVLLVGLVAACGAPPTSSGTTPTPAPVLALPAALAPYHLFVTDLETGDVAELGARTYHVALSVHGLGLSSDGRTLYVTDIADNDVVAYPVAGNGLGQPVRVPVGVQPVHMVETPDGRALFVTNYLGSTVSVIDPASWKVTATVHVPAEPHGIAISPDHRWVYVACVSGGAVAVIDAASQLLAATVQLPVGAQPYSVGVSRDGRYLYVPDSFAARLFVVDASTRRVVGAVKIGLRAALVARSADGATLYVTNGGEGTVSVLDLASDPTAPPVRATIRVGASPHGLALTPDGRYLVVANRLGNSLSVIATATDTVVANIQGEKYPNDVISLP